MAMRWRRILKWVAIAAAVPVGIVALFSTALAYPQPFFGYHTQEGRLALYSDRPFDVRNADRILVEVNRRISLSPLDTHAAHAIFVTNSDWRRHIFFSTASGAAGINVYPITRNVFLRHSDIDHNTLFGASGKAAEPPRTFTYYVAHEITHSLTGKREGADNHWNRGLPVWVREGYADYVGLGGAGQVDVAAYYARYRKHDPHFVVGSGFYDRYRMLTAYFLDTKGWSVPQLLDCHMTIDQAQAVMDADMAKRG
jgi:hypothetical protein